jgi:hypothetical protein
MEKEEQKSKRAEKFTRKGRMTLMRLVGDRGVKAHLRELMGIGRKMALGNARPPHAVIKHTTTCPVLEEKPRAMG